jgi:alkylresorcinol/alkylpyrone synthase
VAVPFDVEILSVATANPRFRLPQSEAAFRAKQLFPHLRKLWPLYENTGIEFRYNCEPIEWYLRPHSWEERTQSFHRHARDLLEQVTVKATEAAGVGLDAIDMIVTNTITGLAIPSLDAMLLNRLKLPPTVERLPIFGLGCGAGVAGLARAARLAHVRLLSFVWRRRRGPASAQYEERLARWATHYGERRMVLAKYRAHHGLGH